MKTIWIEQSMSMGGRLELYGNSKTGYSARMAWPHTGAIVVALGKTLNSALNNLNDAAQEMVDKGVV